MSCELDKSVERKPKRRIMEDLSSDNSGSKDKLIIIEIRILVRNIFIA